jgi:hypothetical protein
LLVLHVGEVGVGFIVGQLRVRVLALIVVLGMAVGVIIPSTFAGAHLGGGWMVGRNEVVEEEEVGGTGRIGGCESQKVSGVPHIVIAVGALLSAFYLHTT